MKSFRYLLTSVAASLLVVSLLMKVTGFDWRRLEKLITSDGSFDGTALHAFQGTQWGLPFAALIISVLVLFYYLADIGRIPLFTCRKTTFLLITLGIQFSLGLFYITLATYVPFYDTEWYLAQATNFAQGLPIVDSSGNPTAYWPIGYPILLSIAFRLFGPNMYISQILNVLLVSATTYFTYLIAAKIRNQKTARRTALIMALFPSLIFYCLLPMADLLLLLIIVVILYLSLSKSSLANTLLIGFLLGFATLTRPTVLLFAVVIAAYRYVRDRRLKPALFQLLVFGIVTEAVLLPWQIRNFHAFGTFVLASNNGGIHLWMGNNSNSSGGYIDEQTFIPAQTRFWMKDSLNEAQKSEYCFDRGLAYIQEHPVKAILLWPKKLIQLFYKDSHCLTYGFLVNWQTVPATLFMAMIALTEGFYYALGATALLEIIKFLRREKIKPYVWLILGTFLYMMGIHLPFIAEGRYHLPMIPLLAILAAYKPIAKKPVALPAPLGREKKIIPQENYASTLNSIAESAEQEREEVEQ